MKIAIGTDHRGFAHKNYILQGFRDQSLIWDDVGCFDESRCDYPIFAKKVAYAVQEGAVDRGILLCGSGIGMAIAANRLQGVYAGLVWNEEVAALSRQHDNTNILVLPSDFISAEMAFAITTIWLKTKFLEGRYRERIAMID